MPGKRYSRSEILGKLQEAESLSAKGRPIRDIADALGISVMTYYRWRNTYRNAGPVEETGVADRSENATPISALRAENDTLRRLVADLLLEKTALQDALRRQQRRKTWTN